MRTFPGWRPRVSSRPSIRLAAPIWAEAVGAGAPDTPRTASRTTLATRRKPADISRLSIRPVVCLHGTTPAREPQPRYLFQPFDIAPHSCYNANAFRTLPALSRRRAGAGRVRERSLPDHA